MRGLEAMLERPAGTWDDAADRGRESEREKASEHEFAAQLDKPWGTRGIEMERRSPVEPDTVDSRYVDRVPTGMTGPAPMIGDARSGRSACRPKPHVFRANDAPRDCGSPAIGDMPVGLPATGGFRVVVLSVAFTLVSRQGRCRA